MKYLILAILLTGCGIELETGLPKSVDVDVEVPEMPKPEMKMVNGKHYLRMGEYCMVLSKSVEYPSEWTRADEYDGYRGNYSSAEKYFCNN